MSFHPKLEESVIRYLQNKDIAKERVEENKLLLEQIGEMFLDSDEDEITIPLPDGMNAIVTSRFVSREVIDKASLAYEMLIPKSELKTPFDFSAYTAQGKLSPAMITKHTHVERETKVKIVKRKTAPRKRSRKN